MEKSAISTIQSSVETMVFGNVGYGAGENGPLQCSSQAQQKFLWHAFSGISGIYLMNTGPFKRETSAGDSRYSYPNFGFAAWSNSQLLLRIHTNPFIASATPN